MRAGTALPTRDVTNFATSCALARYYFLRSADWWRAFDRWSRVLFRSLACLSIGNGDPPKGIAASNRCSRLARMANGLFCGFSL